MERGCEGRLATTGEQEEGGAEQASQKLSGEPPKEAQVVV